MYHLCLHVVLYMYVIIVMIEFEHVFVFLIENLSYKWIDNLDSSDLL